MMSLHRAALVCLCLLPGFVAAEESPGDPIAEFWAWFETAAPRVYETGDDAVNRDDMAYWLGRIREGLSYEVLREGHKAELIISADGRIASFGAVDAIVNGAPKIRRWKIRALRPRAGRLRPVTVDGATIDPATAFFDLYEDTGRLGVVFYLAQYDAGHIEAYRTAARRLMCQAVGERQVGNDVGFVDFDTRDVRDPQFSRPFVDFREVFNGLRR